jgi:TPP-dependent pyruvate/acetoin dehydrogenase alpha subunit
MISHTKEQLVDFESDIAEQFNAALIKAPVHLSDDNEEQLIDFFTEHDIGEDDWVLSSWRSHYHCLLKGVPPDKLKKAILAGRSISLCFKEHKVLCSGIVTGVIPIAVGIAMDIKLTKDKGRVFCFLGDMTAETGVAHECIKYSYYNNLPIHFCVEDNEKSVCTDTKAVWGNVIAAANDASEYPNVSYYKYSLNKYPHAGAGKRVQF